MFDHVVPKNKYEQEALEFGIDISLTRCNLMLSYEQRVIRHQQALELMKALQECRKKLYEDTNKKGVKL